MMNYISYINKNLNYKNLCVMNYDLKQITGEIINLYHLFKEQKLDVHIKLLVAEMFKRHQHELSDTTFSNICVGTFLRDLIRKTINDFIEPEKTKDARQLNMFGRDWKYLQEYYLVNRDGEDIFVPTEKMTITEVKEKAKMHRKQAIGHWYHADELDQVAQIMEMNEVGVN